MNEVALKKPMIILKLILKKYSSMLSWSKKIYKTPLIKRDCAMSKVTRRDLNILKLYSKMILIYINKCEFWKTNLLISLRPIVAVFLSW